jgi:hypothetical protein
LTRLQLSDLDAKLRQYDGGRVRAAALIRSGPAFFQNTPFYAVTEMLRELLAWRGDESAEEQLTQLETRLVLAGLKPAEALPLIAPLLNLPIPAKYPPLPLPSEQQRRRLARMRRSGRPCPVH